ncbi:MAG: hypothetical protein MZU91_08930 [Desulfosudis oleivorans]|nr:hypothetical protein [Desulfosudis oleivorans]
MELHQPPIGGTLCPALIDYIGKHYDFEIDPETRAFRAWRYGSSACDTTVKQGHESTCFLWARFKNPVTNTLAGIIMCTDVG